MKKVLITNCTLILQDRLASDCSLLLEDGKISAIVSAGDLVTALEETVDAGGGYLAPGYVDLHTHGLRGFSVDAGEDRLRAISRVLPQYGVTGVLPTLLPKPKGADAAYLAALAQVHTEGAEILGFHLEGPFISIPGAIPREYLGTADIDRVRALIEAASPFRTIFSVSPDFDDILSLIPTMTIGGSPVFVTHTQATVEQTQAAIRAGASHATHFYNVFPCPTEKERGVRPCGAVEALLADPDVSVDFILDGEHVDPIAIKMTLQCKGIDKVCLITDSNIGAGLPAGTRFEFGGYEIVHDYMGGPARICKEGPLLGALAGSGLTMDQAVRNAVRLLGLGLPAAIRMASTNPARIAGFDGRKGRIAAGFDADLVLLDQQLNVRQTWVRGRSCYQV